MDVLVCVKRVPGTGSKILITADGRDVDTRHLGFTVGPHEECAIEEAVRLAERYGGTTTVLTVGPPEAAEQVRYALSMGADQGVLVETGPDELDPEATASAIVDAVGTLELRFDLVLFGNETPDAGNYQVGIRVAHRLGLPIAGGVKGIEPDPAERRVRLRRDTSSGVEVYEAALPAAVAVKEGLNLPRYPTIRGRLRAKKAVLRTLPAAPRPGGLRKVRLRQPADTGSSTIMLGQGAEAAPAVVDVLTALEVF